MNAMLSQSFVYDAAALFGFGAPAKKPLPERAPGEVVIHYGGWSLQELRDSDVGRRLMSPQDWYNENAWSSDKLSEGTYRLRVPVPGSNNKPYEEQERTLPHGECPAFVALVATALLAHSLQTGEDLLKNDGTRCEENTVGGAGVTLRWLDGRLIVSAFSDAMCDAGVWMSSLRTS